MFKLPKLPYAFDALEPYIDAQTMEIHYTKHHQGYTDKLNTALESSPEYFNLPAEKIVKEEMLGKLPDNVRTAVRNNAGGYLNHSIFWNSMIPGGSKPSPDFGKLLSENFGSYEKFTELFSTAAATLFGSGWVWLIAASSKLEILQTPNQDNPLMSRDVKVLLGLDVWEHAYYLKYQNRRPEYIEAWWHTINWEEVECRLNTEKYDTAQ